MLKEIVRTKIEDLHLPIGKKARLYRIFYEFSPGKGRALILPIDQGLEHGPRDFFPNPDAADPDFQLRLSIEGGFSAIAFHIGLAEKYLHDYAGRIPVILKVNGKTEIPPDNRAFSPLTGTVEDAVRIGADAVGYTLYVGSPAQDQDIRQFNEVRKECEKYGMPLIMWSYPRGEAIEAKGGRDSFYAVDYAARVACELGADVVKLNFPKPNPEKDKLSPRPYDSQKMEFEETVRKVIASAGRTLVLISGGEKKDDEDLTNKARLALECGAAGLIFGRNIWQRPYSEALNMAQKIGKMMASL